jgi:hypothetical protein
METLLGQTIKGFWINKEYFDIAGTVKEIKAIKKNKTAIVLTTSDRDIITWVSKVAV